MSRPLLPPAAMPASQNGLVETLTRAFAAYDAGDLSQAAHCCRLVLTAQKKQFDAIHLMGLIALRRGNHGDARRLIRQAIKVNPRSADAHTNYAMVINDAKGPAEALVHLNRALAIDPDHVIALNNRGNFLWRLKR